MTTPNKEDQSESLFHRLTYFFGTTLAYPNLGWFNLDLVVSSVRKHPNVWAVCALFLAVFLLLRHVRNRRLPPGPWAWPIVGHLTYLLTNPHFR